MSKFPTSKLAAPCISLILGATVYAQTIVPAPEVKDEDVPQKLEAFEVTGSRIRRLDAATPQPVVTYLRTDIQASGYTNLQDLLKNAPSNSGTSNQTFQASSFTRGASTVNPRGLGTNRFLVLINGRRAGLYALGTSASTSVFDFNSIPLNAIDRIEWLKDGASAIYGSDAVSGVYNIILRKDYEGLEVTTTYGNTTGHDISYRAATLLAGARAKNTQVSVMASYSAQNASFMRDYDRSKTSDYTLGGTRVGPQFVNQNSPLSFPFNVAITAAQATALGFDLSGLPSGTNSINIVSNSSPAGQGSPTLSGFSVAPANVIPNQNRYDFAESFQIEPEQETLSTFVSLNHDFSPNVHGYATVAYNNNTINYQFTPVAMQFTATPLPARVPNPVSGGTPATYSTLFIPATNPYNPFGINLTGVLGRANFGPPRGFDVESNATAIVAGVKGTFLDNFDWDTGYQHSTSTVTTASRNQIRVTDFQNALLGTTRATAFNPFGPSENAALLQNLFTTSNGSSKFKSDLWDVTLSNSRLFALPEAASSFVTGNIGMAAGFEWRQESLDSRPDTQAYIGTGGGLPFKGQRTVSSEYLEATVPFFSARGFLAESQLAVRREKYSDFGDTTKPKFAAKLQLPKNRYVGILLRGSLSQSFAAPNLGQVYSAQTTGFTSTVLSDPLRPTDPAAQIRTVSGGAGPGVLRPEQAKIKYYGIVVDLPYVRSRGWGELSFDVDFFEMKMTNVITTPGAATILSRPDLFPDALFVVRDNTSGTPGPISYVKTTPANLARQKYRGVDYTIEYSIQTTSLGKFTVRAQATQIFYIGFNSGVGIPDANNVGLYPNPRWNGNLLLRWSSRVLRIDNLLNYAGGFTNDLYFTQPGNPLFGMNPKITWNPTVRVDLSRYVRGTELIVGATNVLDTQPNLVGRETPGFDLNLTPSSLVRGRFIHVSLRKEF